MIKRLTEESRKVLEKLFNNYCLFTYSKLYPMTENNVIKYFQVMCEAYFEDRCQFVEVKKIRDDKIIVSFLYKDSRNTDSGNLIEDNCLMNREIMEIVDKKIYDNKA